jgi:6-methylsalicylate decarboxylase
MTTTGSWVMHRRIDGDYQLGGCMTTEGHAKAGKIDVHHHVLPPGYLAALDRRGLRHAGGGDIPFPEWDPEAAIEAMDRYGIQAAVASVASPGVWFGDAGLARSLARRCNEHLAGLVESHPGRFGAFASLPLPDTDGAVAEAAYALDTLGCDGVVLLGSVADRFLGDSEFDELMQELNRRKAVAFIHPHGHSSSRTLGLGFAGALFEFPVDTTRAVLNLVLSGTLERYPDIRWIVAHAGGAVPFLAWRFALADQHPMYQLRAPQGVLAYLRRLYFETALSPSPYAMKPVLDLAGPGHILFGSDYPWAPAPAVAAQVAQFERLPVFDPAVREAVARTNALALFPGLARRIAATSSWASDTPPPAITGTDG